MRAIVFALLLGFLLGACEDDLEELLGETESAPVTPAGGAISNPERGFYHHTSTHSDSYAALERATTETYRRDENITLILRVFYLELFVTSAISQSFLTAMEEDFAILRQDGLKAIVRFAYTDVDNGSPPYGDAERDRMLAHIAQIAPVLAANKDVIAVVQAGWIGIWGEWSFSDHFTPDADYAARLAVVEAMQQALGMERAVQVRKPGYKQGMFGRPTGAGGAMQESQAWAADAISLTGHHNDCFLASTTDFGTYDDLEGDKAFLEADSRYVPVGGETCWVSDRSVCGTALEELARFHWSYLNTDFRREVLDGFAAGGCLEEIKARLGYRLLLRSAAFSSAVRPGSSFQATLTIANEGFAAPINSRPVRLLLRNGASGALHGVALPENPRAWLPEADVGVLALDYEVCTPADLPEGSYELLLHLPDAAPALADDPAYAIRLANSGVWEQATGYNILNATILVDSGTAAHACGTSLTLE